MEVADMEEAIAEATAEATAEVMEVLLVVEAVPFKQRSTLVEPSPTMMCHLPVVLLNH